MSSSKIEKIDNVGIKCNSERKYRRYLKKALHRRERHLANRNPEQQPQYKKFNGWSH